MYFFQSAAAEQEIDAFVEKQAMEDDMRKEKEKFVAGCKTVDNKTLINNSVSEDVKQRLKSEEIKLLGNEEFKAGNYNRAEEYYTSAILQFDKVSTLIIWIHLKELYEKFYVTQNNL